MKTLPVVALVVLVSPVVIADDPSADATPPYERLLTSADAVRALELQLQIDAAKGTGRYEQAIPLAEELLSLRTKVQGADHWEAVNQRWDVHTLRTLASLSADKQAGWRRAARENSEAALLEAHRQYAQAQPMRENYRRWCELLLGKDHPETGLAYHALAENLDGQENYPEAQRLHEQALSLIRDMLGDNHPNTSLSCNGLAYNLTQQSRFVDAYPLYQTALHTDRALFGEHHTNTAASYNNLAYNLKKQGKFADAQVLYQRSLDLFRELVGEHDSQTAVACNNLAGSLDDQGKHAAAQPLFRKALDLFREQSGDTSTNTAIACNNLALNLKSQGKYVEARSLYDKALTLCRALFGEQHTATAMCYNNLAENLTAQREYADAQPFIERSLAIRRGLLGELHVDTAMSYNNLAVNLNVQERFADAQPYCQKALDIRRELLGERHADTALSYSNLAVNLHAQGKYAEAQLLFEKALEVCRDQLGDSHPQTGLSSCCLAINLNAQGNYVEARAMLASAAASYEAARLGLATRGLERAVFGAKRSPYGTLAATEARLGRMTDAWFAAEQELARGMSDESAARSRGALTDEEQRLQTELTSRLSRIQPRMVEILSQLASTTEEPVELTELRAERHVVEGELSGLAAAVSQRERAGLGQVQAALLGDAAMVLWVDVTDWSGRVQEHWGCVVRHFDEPRWERLPGSGPEGTWTQEDSALPRLLSEAVAGQVPATELAKLQAKLNVQRFAPLKQHLNGVRRLFVVPVNEMAGVPVDILTDSAPVSFVPSGTFLARLKDRPAPGGNSLLALGDPAFRQSGSGEELPLPPGGLLITQVVSGSNADQAGLRAGDTLLAYAGAELTAVEQLGELIQSHVQDATVAVSIWRNGNTAERQLSGGKLGVALDKQAAPEAIAEKRRMDRLIADVTRGGNWAELPGTTVEVARLRTLVGEVQTTALTRSDASEQALEQLRATGKLKDFRYLHFATHGEPNNARSFESALILSQDQITGEIPKGGGKYFDGRLTANEVLENWELNADLVTLSACESALGRPGGGDGLLGFAQAFLLAGARSVCLSLWKVDDTATALLMDRFYQNLLGKRESLEEPMPKAEALAEAKLWLRDLTSEEVKERTQDISAGVTRGKGETAIPVKLDVPGQQVDSTDPTHPFSHPRFWAAFVLIGDPD